MVSMFAAEEDRFESRNLDDSDAHSEATGTTEEDLRPVKVSCRPVCTALYMHAFSPWFNCSLIHVSLIPSVTRSCIHPFSHLCWPSNQAHSPGNRQVYHQRRSVPHSPALACVHLSWGTARHLGLLFHCRSPL